MPIDLFRGHPSNNLLASHEILEGAQYLLTPDTRPGDDDYEIRHPLTYGSDPGAEDVRELIAQWSFRAHGEDRTGQWRAIDKDAINLTNGASFGAQTALQQCTCAHTGYTKRAFLVTPTYFLINSVFSDAGFNGKLTAVPESVEHGVDLDFLQQQLEYYDSLEDTSGGLDAVDKVLGKTTPPRKVYRYVVYCVPTFSNPTGSTMSLGARQRLVELARKHDALVIADDVYDLLDYRAASSKPEPLPPRLVAIDRSFDNNAQAPHGNVISNCTFSKLLGPGLRVGWQETSSRHLAQQLSRGGAIQSGGTPAHMNSMVVGELLKRGVVDKVVANLNAVYGDRAQQMASAMQRCLPHGTVVQGGGGGYFFWVTLPPKFDTMAITKLCQERGVVLAPENSFQVQGDEHLTGSSFRVSLSYEAPHRLVEAVEIWGQVCAAYNG